MLLLTKIVHTNPSWTTYIPIIISVLSLALSLYSAISTYYEKHIKTKVYIRWSAEFNNQLNLCLLVSNMSSRPSTITDIGLKISDNNFKESTWFPALLALSGSQKAYSDCTPLNIPPRSSKTFVISFQNLNYGTYSSQHLTLRYLIDDVRFERIEEVKVQLSSDDFALAVQDRLR